MTFRIVVATILACEIALNLPFQATVHALAANLRRAISVMSSKNISDTWKERIIPVYCWRSLISSFKLLVFLTALCLPFLASGLGLTTGSRQTLVALSQFSNILLMSAVAVCYIWLRLKVFDGKLFSS